MRWKVIAYNRLGAKFLSGLNSIVLTSIYTGYYCTAFLFHDKKEKISRIKIISLGFRIAFDKKD
jgi:hypothetical protein